LTKGLATTTSSSLPKQMVRRELDATGGALRSRRPFLVAVGVEEAVGTGADGSMGSGSDAVGSGSSMVVDG